MAISHEGMILIIICSAAASVVIGYSMYRLMFFKKSDSRPFQMSDEQVAYMRSVRDKNVQGLMMEVGMSKRV
jgi:hypothetical protein